MSCPDVPPASSGAGANLNEQLALQFTNLLACSGSTYCSASETASEFCIIGNMYIDCDDVVISCKNDAAQKEVLNCESVAPGGKYPGYIQLAADALLKTVGNDTEKLQLLLQTLKNKGIAYHKICSDPKDTACVQDNVTAMMNTYLGFTCSAVLSSDQSVYVPYIVLTGDACKDVNVNLYNTLDQSATCSLSSTQQLLIDAGLAPPVGDAPPGENGGDAPPENRVPTGIFIAILAIVVIIFFCVCGFLGLLARRARR